MIVLRNKFYLLIIMENWKLARYFAFMGIRLGNASETTYVQLRVRVFAVCYYEVKTQYCSNPGLSTGTSSPVARSVWCSLSAAALESRVSSSSTEHYLLRDLLPSAKKQVHQEHGTIRLRLAMKPLLYLNQIIRFYLCSSCFTCLSANSRISFLRYYC